MCAANVETMFFTGATPWHGIGIKVEEEISSKDAIKLAGLDWLVNKEPIYTIGDDGSSKIIDGYYATVRDSDRANLGIVQDRYEVVQNFEKFEFIDSILGSNMATIHTAGSLRGGRVVWILAKLSGIARIKDTDDTIERYLLISGSHDGTTPIVANFTPIRVVCQNTLNIALKECISCVKIKHTRTAPDQFKQAEKVMKNALVFYENFETKANWLADQKFTDRQMTYVLNKIFNVESREDASTRTENYIDTIREIAENGNGNSVWRGTAWAAFNAFTEFADWRRSVRNEDDRPDARLYNNWLGSSADFKQKSFELIEESIKKAA